MPKDRKIKVVDSLFLRSNCPPVFENANFSALRYFFSGFFSFNYFLCSSEEEKNQRTCLTWNTGYESERTENTEGSQGFHVEAFDLQRGKDGAHNSGKRFQNRIMIL